MINPITDLTANEFLVLYLGLILTATFICLWRRTLADWTVDLPPPSVPTDLDPYEVAYLRGDKNEVTRVAIVSLTEQGYLEVKRADRFFNGTFKLLSLGDSDQRFVTQVDDGPDPEKLSSLERLVIDWFATAKRIEKIFEGDDLPTLVESRCLHYQEKLQAAHLLTPDDVRERITNMALTAGGFIAVLGGPRLVVGLLRDRPVGFLIMMSVAAGIALAIIGSAPRPSKLGKRYLGNLLEELKPRMDELRWRGQRDRFWDVRSAPELTLLVGAFGITVLADTPYSVFEKVFRKSCGPAAGGCGGGCGGCGG